MKYLNSVLLCFILTIASKQGTFADVEDKSDELEQEIKTQNGNLTSSVESGPPDSHEAMNNRELHAKAIRDKRSYEFLMGLVKNNSKFEITKVDPAKQPSQDKDDSAAASELLLELLVKIAAHPDHWSKVHNLLEQIDNDLLESKKIVDSMMDNDNVQIQEKSATSPHLPPSKKKESLHHLAKNEWPTFDQLESELISKNQGQSNNIGFVNTAQPEENNPLQTHKPSMMLAKPFAYHRVTGRPMYLNKNPKAYIAVSVIAPKPINTRSENNNNENKDDLSLEKELRQLKPWTHNDNLKNMASIRSRWIIDNGSNKNGNVNGETAP